MRWKYSLLTKLSLALFVLITIIGCGALSIGYYAIVSYHEELTQRLNQNIAKHMVAEHYLITNDQPNLKTLQVLARHAMDINPNTEIYLLDTEGKVISHALPQKNASFNRIDLDPIQRFVSNPEKFPIKGDDPRKPGIKKIFSATALMQNGTLHGYLYIILGGKIYDGLLSSLKGSVVLTVSTIAISIFILFSFFAGVITFFLLTSRLRTFTQYIEEYKRGDLTAPFNPPLTMRCHADEIHSLMLAFKTMADHIKEQYHALQKLDRNRRELVTNISHDLRTPLVSVQGYIETVLLKYNTIDDKEKIAYLQKVHKHGKRLRTLINELFELSRLDTGGMQPQKESFYLLDLLQDLQHDFSFQASQREINLTINPRQGDFMVYADIAMIQRVLENLIENALRYTPRGGWVKINLVKSDDDITVQIADSGYGIGNDDIAHIFKGYYRAKTTARYEKCGTGLGLAIVKRILDLHNALITVSSKLDQGTCFTFKLPLGHLQVEGTAKPC